jgi:AbrB family looped-hinge helix DNA binding protein
MRRIIRSFMGRTRLNTLRSACQNIRNAEIRKELMKQNSKENLVVSARGQITLPAAMRRALGLSGSAVVTAEERGGKIVLTPAVVVETEMYSDADIAVWDEADAFRSGERTQLKARLKRRRV